MYHMHNFTIILSRLLKSSKITPRLSKRMRLPLLRRLLINNIVCSYVHMHVYDVNNKSYAVESFTVHWFLL